LPSGFAASDGSGSTLPRIRPVGIEALIGPAVWDRVYCRYEVGSRERTVVRASFD
jgi:hypothetical protein